MGSVRSLGRQPTGDGMELASHSLLLESFEMNLEGCPQPIKMIGSPPESLDMHVIVLAKRARPSSRVRASGHERLGSMYKQRQTRHDLSCNLLLGRARQGYCHLDPG
jgi:hypothetical protein